MYRLKREEWRQLLLVPCIDWRGKIEDSCYLYHACIDWRGKIEDSRVTVQPIGAWQLDQEGILFQRNILAQSQNRYWNRDFARFHLIFMISPDFTYFWFFQAIQPVMYVLTRKSYDFTSQNVILTTLVGITYPYPTLEL